MEASSLTRETYFPSVSAAQADKALEYIFTITKDIYFIERGTGGPETERATIEAPPHMPHRENIAEHQQHVAFSSVVLWQNREELGLQFPPAFDVYKACYKGIIHDKTEVKSGDIDAMLQNENVVQLRGAQTLADIALMRVQYPFLSQLVDDIESYEEKNDYEDDYVNDIDKVVATVVIMLDGGQRWHDWEGKQTSREHMIANRRSRLRTDFGQSVYDAIERVLDAHPQYFPASVEAEPEPAEIYTQYRLF
jgi:5'-deoxynucleotidase YfbR-like HD superfamily hydrolase